MVDWAVVKRSVVVVVVVVDDEVIGLKPSSLSCTAFMGSSVHVNSAP